MQHSDLELMAALAIAKQPRAEAAEMAQTFRDMATDRGAEGEVVGDLDFWLSLLTDWSQSVIDDCLS